MKAKYEMPGGRKDLVARLLYTRAKCEAGMKIWAFYTGQSAENLRPLGHPIYCWEKKKGENGIMRHKCHGISVDVHELLARSAGGSILDESNCITVCRACHGWIGDHPKEAMALGLRKSRYAEA